MCLRTTLIGALLLCPGLRAQVYFIAGTPTHNLNTRYAVKLLKVNAAGTTSIVKELISQEHGLDWIAVSPDLHAAVMLEWDHYTALVFDLDKLETVKQCDLQVNGDLTGGKWLANVPGRGPSYQAWLDDIDSHALFRSLSLSPDVPCGEWLDRKVGPQEIIYISANGNVANPFVLNANSDGTFASVDRDGSLFTEMGAGNRVRLEFRLPAGLSFSEEPGSFIGISVDNLQVRVITYRGSDEQLHYLVFRKRDQSWHQIPDSLSPAMVSGAGPYISLTETALKPSISKNIHPKRSIRELKGLKDQEMSAGAKDWNTHERDTGPNLRTVMGGAEYVYTGKLSLYDIETGQVFTIETNQGNSEILLVDNQMVYYRINDRLYSAEINKSGLGAPQLLATDEIINDVHWAFSKR
jgi:hypothetical protein